MLSDNIRTLRKQKGYFQETLAEKLNVVRQVVSKWKKEFSIVKDTTPNMMNSRLYRIAKDIKARCK